MRYTIKDFHRVYRNDAACLEFIYRRRHPNGATCIKCGKVDSFYAVEGRRTYACVCGHQISPTAGTIFHKSPTSLKSWFFAMFLMTNSKNGVSAKELERQIGVTYKCAWRMAHQIRQLLAEEGVQLKGIVEADETYIGGKKKGLGRAYKGNKTPVIGVLERQGNIVAKVTGRVLKTTVIPHIRRNVEKGSAIFTDQLTAYKILPHKGYSHDSVNHGAHEYVRGIVHTNSIEGFWSQLKRSINGTFHHVSRKHLQKYVNEFSYRYNRRKSERPMFCHLIENVGELRGPAV
jgi:transposase-like protein